MPNLFQHLVNKLRGIRYAISVGRRIYAFGALYSGTYSNWKHDPKPTIWIQYSDQKYTHGLNVNYLSYSDKVWLMNTIYIIKKANQIINGKVFYQFLKQRRPSIVKTAYRLYFTPMLQLKLVSAGITRLDRLVYKGFPDSWINMLNERIKPSEMAQAPLRISFSRTELQERVIAASNTVDIKKAKVSQTGSFGTAPWAKGR
jgi:hypothetical protein